MAAASGSIKSASRSAKEEARAARERLKKSKVGAALLAVVLWLRSLLRTHSRRLALALVVLLVFAISANFSSDARLGMEQWFSHAATTPHDSEDAMAQSMPEGTFDEEGEDASMGSPDEPSEAEAAAEVDEGAANLEGSDPEPSDMSEVGAWRWDTKKKKKKQEGPASAFTAAPFSRAPRAESGFMNPQATEQQKQPHPRLRPKLETGLRGPPKPPTRKKPFLMVHIHKAAGTYMCNMAAKARERIVQPNLNCNWKDHDSYLDSGTRWRVNCDKRHSFFTRNGFTYGQIERELWPADLCWDEFSYGILLREPIDLMHSELNYRGLYHGGLSKDAVVADFKRRVESDPPLQTDHTQLPEWKTLDNFQTRILANAMAVPAGQIGPEHLERARQVLANFTAVGRVADLKIDMQRNVFFDSLGWSNEALQESVAAALPRNQVKKDLYDFTDLEREWLQRINQYDIELFRWYSPAR